MILDNRSLTLNFTWITPVATPDIAPASRILKLGEEGVADYMKFLKGGNSLDPIDLLKLAGVDMTGKEPIREAMNVFSGLIDELEALINS